MIDHGKGGEDPPGIVVKKAAGVALEHCQSPVDVLLCQMVCLAPKQQIFN